MLGYSLLSSNRVAGKVRDSQVLCGYRGLDKRLAVGDERAVLVTTIAQSR
jgi:hypothetical protein